MMKGFQAWWGAREPREQLLISVAVFLSLVLGLYQFAWVPSVAFRERAEQAYRIALSDNAAVHAATRPTGETRQVNTGSQPLQLVVTQTSGFYGLEITRMLPDESTGLNLWLDNVPAETFYAWLSELEREHGVRVEKASVRLVSAEAHVNANIFVRRVE